MPWHFGNWHFGGAQERKGSVDTCIISKNNEQAIFSVADKTTEYGITHIIYLIYSGCCQYFRYLRYPINASSSKYLFCARSIREKKSIQIFHAVQTNTHCTRKFKEKTRSNEARKNDEIQAILLTISQP